MNFPKSVLHSHNMNYLFFKCIMTPKEKKIKIQYSHSDRFGIFDY